MLDEPVLRSNCNVVPTAGKLNANSSLDAVLESKLKNGFADTASQVVPASCWHRRHTHVNALGSVENKYGQSIDSANVTFRCRSDSSRTRQCLLREHRFDLDAPPQGS